MKSFLPLVLTAGLLAAAAAYADPPPASDASIHQLLQTMHADKVIDVYMTQIRTVMRSSAMQSVGHPLDPQEQQILDRHLSQLGDIMQNQFTWAKLEPALTDIYRKNFTQQEVDAMLAFYKTPSGQSMIAKMPEVTREGMLAGQGMAQSAMPQIRQAAAAMKQELDAYEAGKAQVAPKP